ncbi:MAG: PTS system mannose/fructose/sorbose family transporter subunit IID [Anaerorhabdus sp.]|uniref:PTS system mannose/fructose/sorbose family transporter subunit IID n=1 Tax=Anaerorhabdus sp. TaxID=1872524 RepID=UPI003A84F343
MSLIQAILISLIYFLASSTLIGVGFFTLCKPMVSGFFVGLILGNPVLGTQIGASVNLMYMGSLSTGGSLSSDSTLACIVATSLGIVGGQPIEASMAVAVPLGLLGTMLWFGRLGLSTMFVPLADRYAREGKASKFWVVNVLIPQGFLFLISAVPVFIIIYFGTEFIQDILNFLGANVLGALIIIGGMLPALGLGLTLKTIFQGQAKVYFFIGFLLIQYFGLNTISMAFIALIIAILYMYGQNKDGEPISLSFSSAGDTPPTSGLITKRDLIQSCINWGFHAQACYNYERMQGIGFCHAMVPIFKKLYKEGSPEMAEAMQRHTGFFNTAPQFAAMIPGLIAAMEEKRFQGATDIDEGALTAVKTSLMGPLSGIGDTVCQGILVPLLLTFFIGMAMDGNILGPILYFIIITVIVVAMCYFSYMLGYRKGSEAILALLESGLINKIIDAAKVMGCVVIGALVASFVTVNTGIVLSVNQTSFNLQTQLFDVIVPGLLPLILTLGCYKLTDKGVSSTKIMLILVVIVVIGGLTGILV